MTSHVQGYEAPAWHSCIKLSYSPAVAKVSRCINDRTVAELLFVANRERGNVKFLKKTWSETRRFFGDSRSAVSHHSLP